MSVPQIQITARDYYVLTKGIALDAAIAIVAVFYYESKLKPGSQGYQITEAQGKPRQVLNPHGAYGIASWNGDRQGGLQDFAIEHSLPVDALETQLAFALAEIEKKYHNCWAAIRSGISYTAIIPILVNEYENPKNKQAEIEGSLKIARALAALPPPPAFVPHGQLPDAAVPAMPAPAPNLPTISSTTAGRRVAQHDYALRMRDVLLDEKAAYNKDIDEEIASWERMAEIAVPPALPSPTPQPAGHIGKEKSMNPITSNPKTSTGGAIALLGALWSIYQSISTKTPPDQVQIGIILSSIGSGIGLIFSQDWNKTAK